MKKILTYAIETSCDETSIAIVRDGREILCNLISSQISTHKKFGGVVPEIASRMHLECINELIRASFVESGVNQNEIDLVAVTKGPGLVGALLVGISAAKAMAASLKVPLIGVNHIEGHISANYLTHKDLEPPFLSLVASGGHTYLIHVQNYSEYKVIGRTRDDACGESFDKVARVLGLGYPGGPVIDRVATEGNEKAIEFPRVMLESGSYDFSFSGLKTAVLNYLNKEKQMGNVVSTSDVAASFQQAAIEVLVKKAFMLLDELGLEKIAVSGGVAANSLLRKLVEEESIKRSTSFYFPSKILCTDNAAMIGSAGYYNYINGEQSDFRLKVYPSLEIE